ncbi:MAG: shikimate dehydrogenase [Nitrospinae bacterium]|nr:shikimate dehydrogenase [Nitrospinota bacterium]
MICVPIIARTNEEAVHKMAAASLVADVIELRIDYIPSPDLPKLLHGKPKPVIVTCRTLKDRGEFGKAPEHEGGSEEKRLGMLLAALKLGADYVDIEFDAPEDSRQRIFEAAGSPGRVILSSHDFERTPASLEPLKNRMLASFPGAIIKIAVFAQSIDDNLKILDLLKNKKEGERLAAFCMGENGEISRVLSPLFGGELTFGSLGPGEESAPGQIPASVLRDVYRVNQLKEDVEIFGLIGNPVKESMGYLIHNRSYIKMGMNRVYLPFLVKDLRPFIEKFKGMFKGMSVTMPFKQDIIPLLDEVDPLAARIGAVNTIDARSGKLVGYNTDSSGAVKAMEDLASLQGKTVFMIGAGGVARAIGFGTANKGAKIIICDVDEARAGRLAEELGGKTCSREEWEDIRYDILVNCSPIGMHPNIEETPFPKEFFRPGSIVFDAVYNPLETRLLKEAAGAGCRVIRGLELFVNQAVDQFELWTGEKAPREIMERTALERLSKNT